MINNYELCKKLKEAGFPQKGDVWYGERPKIYGGVQEFYDGEYLYDAGGFEPGEHDVYKPSLEELIDACGDKFSCIERQEDGSFYCGERYYEEFNEFSCGSTPFEAVANLWLTL